MRLPGWVFAGVLGLAAAQAGAQGGGQAGGQHTAEEWLSAMLAHENEATNERGRYEYVNEERSDRTGGHLWLERVAETDWGKLHYLMMEDGKPLSGDRLAVEKQRLAAEAADPEKFKQAEMARPDNDQHARQMLGLLPKAFIFSEPRTQGDVVLIDYMPNPNYSPANTEEKVLHAMSGTVVIDRELMRMRQVDGHTSQDVSLSFGLASIKAGSNFLTARVHVDGPDWKLGTVHTDIRGKALLFKIARSGDLKHYAFKRIPDGMTVGAAVGMLETN